MGKSYLLEPGLHGAQWAEVQAFLAHSEHQNGQKVVALSAEAPRVAQAVGEILCAEAPKQGGGSYSPRSETVGQNQVVVVEQRRL